MMIKDLVREDQPYKEMIGVSRLDEDTEIFKQETKKWTDS